MKPTVFSLRIYGLRGPPDHKGVFDETPVGNQLQAHRSKGPELELLFPERLDNTRVFQLVRPRHNGGNESSIFVILITKSGLSLNTSPFPIGALVGYPDLLSKRTGFGGQTFID